MASTRAEQHVPRRQRVVEPQPAHDQQQAEQRVGIQPARQPLIGGSCGRPHAASDRARPRRKPDGPGELSRPCSTHRPCRCRPRRPGHDRAQQQADRRERAQSERAGPARARDSRRRAPEQRAARARDRDDHDQRRHQQHAPGHDGTGRCRAPRRAPCILPTKPLSGGRPAIADGSHEEQRSEQAGRAASSRPRRDGRRPRCAGARRGRRAGTAPRSRASSAPCNRPRPHSRPRRTARRPRAACRPNRRPSSPPTSRSVRAASTPSAPKASVASAAGSTHGAATSATSPALGTEHQRKHAQDRVHADLGQHGEQRGRRAEWPRRRRAATRSRAAAAPP